jgi:hypothetical protein
MGQKSAVDRLPEELRARLTGLLQNPAATQAEIADLINEAAGEPLVSRSSVNRYAQRMKRFAEKNRQAKEIADAYLEKCGGDNRVKLGQVINQQIRVAVYDLMLELDDLKNSEDLDALGIAELLHKVARSLREIEAAEKLNAERAESVRKAALAEAAQAVEETAKSNGLTGDTIEKIKKQILGL